MKLLGIVAIAGLVMFAVYNIVFLIKNKSSYIKEDSFLNRFLWIKSIIRSGILPIIIFLVALIILLKSI